MTPATLRRFYTALCTDPMQLEFDFESLTTEELLALDRDLIRAQHIVGDPSLSANDFMEIRIRAAAAGVEI